MKIETRSIWLKARGSRAALLFHGLASSSFEVRGLAEYLFSQGISVYAPTLSFHQSRRLEDLQKASLETWKQNAEKAYQSLSDFPKVFVSGISNGSSLALYLAEKFPLAGVIPICPLIIPGFSVFRFLPQEKIFQWLVRRFDYLPRFDYKMVVDWSLAKDLPRFRKLPAHFTYHSLVLAREVRENLAKIRCPLLVIQARHDNRVDPQGAERLYQRVSSKIKRIFYAENSGHVVVLDIDREAVFKEVAQFIKEN